MISDLKKRLTLNAKNMIGWRRNRNKQDTANIIMGCCPGGLKNQPSD